VRSQRFRPRRRRGSFRNIRARRRSRIVSSGTDARAASWPELPKEPRRKFAQKLTHEARVWSCGLNTRLAGARNGREAALIFRRRGVSETRYAVSTVAVRGPSRGGPAGPDRRNKGRLVKNSNARKGPVGIPQGLGRGATAPLSWIARTADLARPPRDQTAIRRGRCAAEETFAGQSMRGRRNGRFRAFKAGSAKNGDRWVTARAVAGGVRLSNWSGFLRRGLALGHRVLMKGLPGLDPEEFRVAVDWDARFSCGSRISAAQDRDRAVSVRPRATSRRGRRIFAGRRTTVDGSTSFEDGRVRSETSVSRGQGQRLPSVPRPVDLLWRDSPARAKPVQGRPSHREPSRALSTGH